MMQAPMPGPANVQAGSLSVPGIVHAFEQNAPVAMVPLMATVMQVSDVTGHMTVCEQTQPWPLVVLQLVACVVGLLFAAGAQMQAACAPGLTVVGTNMFGHCVLAGQAPLPT